MQKKEIKRKKIIPSLTEGLKKWGQRSEARNNISRLSTIRLTLCAVPQLIAQSLDVQDLIIEAIPCE